MTRLCSDDEAVELANVVDFGLGGAVWSTDEERATKVAEQLEVGMANVNTPAGEGADLPFGGTKRSGFGRELGPWASTNSSTSASSTSRSSARQVTPLWRPAGHSR
jgi:acyl-CoA reductase-like NAD-dependent aldehyde dehydrogenase